MEEWVKRHDVEMMIDHSTDQKIIPLPDVKF